MSKTDKIIAYIMQQLNQIGEDFGWQMGRIGANYENGYMKCNQDSKAHFRKDKIKQDIEEMLSEDHIVEPNKMIDLVEVVRCKNCRHWGTEVAGETDRVKCCEYGKYMVGENGFCVYGEKTDQFRVLTKKVVTNADRIRNMTDEELAELLAESNTLIKCKDCSEPMNEWGSCIGNCENAYLKWLKEKVE